MFLGVITELDPQFNSFSSFALKKKCTLVHELAQSVHSQCCSLQVAEGVDGKIAVPTTVAPGDHLVALLLPNARESETE